MDSEIYTLTSDGDLEASLNKLHWLCLCTVWETEMSIGCTVVWSELGCVHYMLLRHMCVCAVASWPSPIQGSLFLCSRCWCCYFCLSLLSAAFLRPGCSVATLTLGHVYRWSHGLASITVSHCETQVFVCGGRDTVVLDGKGGVVYVRSWMLRHQRADVGSNLDVRRNRCCEQTGCVGVVAGIVQGWVGAALTRSHTPYWPLDTVYVNLLSLGEHNAGLRRQLCAIRCFNIYNDHDGEDVVVEIISCVGK